MTRVLPLLALLGCAGGPSPASQGGLAEEYAPGPGTTFEFVPEGAMQALYEQDPDASVSGAGLATLRIQVTDAAWEMVEGEGRNATLPWVVDPEGLHVGGSHLLPPRAAEGEEGAGVVVEEAGACTVWYGTFEESSTVRVSEGELSGEATLARWLGPVRVSFAGKVWELVYYERPTE